MNFIIPQWTQVLRQSKRSWLYHENMVERQQAFAAANYDVCMSILRYYLEIANFKHGERATDGIGVEFWRQILAFKEVSRAFFAQDPKNQLCCLELAEYPLRSDPFFPHEFNVAIVFMLNGELYRFQLQNYLRHVGLERAEFLQKEFNLVVSLMYFGYSSKSRFGTSMSKWTTVVQDHREEFLGLCEGLPLTKKK